jgi:putative DNA-invertase from lambdoid prophage Rac
MQTIENAVGYCRVSTKKQETINQVDAIKKHGVSIFFRDEGVSGLRPALERTEYKRMMKYLEEHPDVKTIVVFEISRLGRSLLDSISTFINLEKSGYHVISLSEGWTQFDNPQMRSLMVMIVSWMNEQELERTSGRVKAGMEKARVHGTKSGKDIGRPSKIPDREVVEQLRSNQKKWREIAAQFNIDIATLFRYRKQWQRDDLELEVKK